MTKTISPEWALFGEISSLLLWGCFYIAGCGKPYEEKQVSD
ncbi:MAG: hypothetical protein R2792_01410 [Saprospiraceae bacterium]